jgi:hypothetical protein
MRDEMRDIILTGFRQMDFVADPRRGVLAGVVGFGVVGRDDEPRHWWDVVCLALVQLGAAPLIVLHPDAAQDGHGGNLPEPRPGLHVIEAASHRQPSARWSAPGRYGLLASSGADHPRPVAHHGPTSRDGSRHAPMLGP